MAGALARPASGPQPRAALIAGPHWSGELDVGDTNWTTIAVPIPGGPATANHTAGWVVLICGLLLSAALPATSGELVIQTGDYNTEPS